MRRLLDEQVCGPRPAHQPVNKAGGLDDWKWRAPCSPPSAVCRSAVADSFRALSLGIWLAHLDPYQPIDALRSCRTTGPDPSRSASTKLQFVAYGGLGLGLSVSA